MSSSLLQEVHFKTKHKFECVVGERDQDKILLKMMTSGVVEKYLSSMRPRMSMTYNQSKRPRMSMTYILRKRYTNFSLRVTSLQTLDDAKIEGRHIIRLSDQKLTKSV